MATLHIDNGKTLTTTVIVRESDPYSEMVYLKIDKQILDSYTSGSSEIFLTPNQLENLGRFLIRQADEIRTAQAVR